MPVVNTTWLAASGFTHTHTLTFQPAQEDEPSVSAFQINAVARGAQQGDINRCPATYLWLQPADEAETFQVLYVGKAGYGVLRRLRQHAAWFNKTSDAEAKKQSRLPAFNQGNVLVYARLAQNTYLFGQTVPLYATEEHAFYQLFAPTQFNSPHGFPSACPCSEATGEPDKEAAMAEPEIGSPSNEDPSSIPSDLPYIGREDELNETDILNDPHYGQFLKDNPQAAVTASAIFDLLERWKILGLYDRQFVRGFASQPAHCNDVPTFSWCVLGPKRAIPRSTAVRFPLAVVSARSTGAGDPMVCFPIRERPRHNSPALKILAAGPWLADVGNRGRFTTADGRVIIVNTTAANGSPTGIDILNDQTAERGGIFRPENIHDFLRRPEGYVNLRTLLMIYPEALP